MKVLGKKEETMAKNKKRYTYRETAEKLDAYTSQLISWVDEMEKNDLERRQVTTVVTKHGTVVVQVR